MSDQWVLRYNALVTEFCVYMGALWSPDFVCGPWPVVVCRCYDILVIIWPRGMAMYVII